MTIIKFTYQGKSKAVRQNAAFIEDYSNAPKELAKIIREITDITCVLSYGEPTWDSKVHLKSKVTISFLGATLRFDFYHSLYETSDFFTEHSYQADGVSLIKDRGLDSEFLKDVLYSLLCAIRSGAGVHELDFVEFCDEFGYDPDSYKAHMIYTQGCNFSRDIARVFSSDEINAFPS